MRFGAWLVLAVGCSGNNDTDGKDASDDPPVTVDLYAELPIALHFPFADQDFEGGRISFYVPPNPRGVLFAFHGGDGGVETVLQTEWLELYNLLEPEGFGFILAQSIDREQKTWDTFHTQAAESPDFQRLSRIRDYVIEQTELEAETPVFAAGFSNGGAFSHLFTTMALEVGWDVRAFLSHNSSYPATANVPGAYVSAEWDDHGGKPEDMAPMAEQCTNRVGQLCPHIEGTEVLLDPRRFARLPQYSLEQSQQIYDELVTLEYVTAAGERIPPLDDIDALMNQYVAETSAPIPSMPPTQIRVVWATHRVSSQHMREEVAFLLDHL